MLDDVSLILERGMLTALAGPNGAGKTTLLSVLAGLLVPDAGGVSLEGVPLARLDRRERARRVAWLEQGARAAWGMTVREVAALGRLPHGDRGEAEVAAALAACGLEALAERRVDTLSGGEARRAMLARALATGEDALLLDEPAADLDPAQGFALMRLLRREADGAALCIVPGQIARLEEEVARMNGELPPLKSFVLPGGSPASAWAHHARTIARAAERATVALANAEPVNPEAVRYLNRLSDHLFVLGRWLNGRGATEVLWQPGATR